MHSSYSCLPDELTVGYATHTRSGSPGQLILATLTACGVLGWTSPADLSTPRLTGTPARVAAIFRSSLHEPSCLRKHSVATPLCSRTTMRRWCGVDVITIGARAFSDRRNVLHVRPLSVDSKMTPAWFETCVSPTLNGPPSPCAET